MKKATIITGVVLSLLSCARMAQAQEWSAETIATVVLAWTDDHDCGHVCTDDRRDGAEDRSEYVVTEDDAVALAEAILAAREVYPNVPVEIFLATGWHEAGFQRFAVGPGGECGMFQQTPRYMDPEHVREALETYDARCDYLQDVAQSVWSFAESVSSKIARYGDNWACAYNRGSSRYRESGCGLEGNEYREDIERTAARIEHNLRVVARSD